MEYSTLLTHFSNITHAFTTRHGGYSLAPYSSNNLGFHVGDNKDTVFANHKHLAEALSYSLQTLVYMKQIHSTKVIVVHDETFDTPPICDALITNKTNTPLMIMSADCTPILLYDDVTKVIGVIHAGRAGAFNNIIESTISQMKKSFQVQSENIYAVLGASIQLCCYEVSEEIMFEAEKKGLGYSIHTRENKYYLDINAILHKQLQMCGVAEYHIEDIRACSACLNETYFSYRADKQTTGRMAGVIMLNP